MVETPDALVLCGGFGLRLRGVIGEAPKPMATVNGRPFLELILKQLKRNGFSRIVLSVGYKHEVIREYFGDEAFGLKLVYSVETSPLGTGGALRQALDHIESQDHRASKAAVTIVVIPDFRPDAGSIVVDQNYGIKNFAEKRFVPEARFLSAGIYVLGKSLIGTIPPEKKISLEQETFPEWLTEGHDMRAFVCHSPCIDIGTPDRYLEAQKSLNQMEREGIFESEAQS
jgi:D-glycero-alpha-D-manno-heptose 1-phosphate guanylyltransferase